MPITYSISERESLILVRAFGSVTTRELLNLLDGISSDGSVQSSISVLIDCTEVKSVMLVTGIREIAQETAKLTKGKSVKIAIAALDAFVYGLGRAFTSYGDLFGVKAQVFRSFEDACLCLNIQDPMRFDVIDFTNRKDACLIQ